MDLDLDFFGQDLGFSAGFGFEIFASTGFGFRHFLTTLLIYMLENVGMTHGPNSSFEC